MAAPHLAGAIALLWSAAPSLIGDIDATRALLDGTAIDKADRQCGGTADDNNVYGEGRLDALALLNAAPDRRHRHAGRHGHRRGHRQPARRRDRDAHRRDRPQLTTGADGTYSATLPAGDYPVAVVGVRLRTQTTHGDRHRRRDHDARLRARRPRDMVTVSGTVTDGSGHGWPLYAKVTVEGPAADDYTTRATAATRSSCRPGDVHAEVEPQYPGYQPSDQAEVTVGDGQRHPTSRCRSTAPPARAPGYKFGSDGRHETFDGTTLPAGWTVVDNKGNGQVWQFDDPATAAT